MKNSEKKQRLTLSLLFSFIVFCILLLTFLIVGTVVFLLVNLDVFTIGVNGVSATWVILLTLGTCLVIGTGVSIVIAKFPLKPFNSVINGLNKLASGDYKVRIKLGRILKINPVMVELSDSFNTLADELENTEMLRSDFINNFSHEFKTPIVSISGFAKLLKRGNLTEQQKSEYLAVIEEEALRLSYMATNVLNLTKVENQTILTDVSNYNLSEQLRSCVLLLEEKWASKDLDFYLEFGEHMISANEELLKQVWINLIDNAIKFATVGSTIDINVKCSEESVFVSFINQGEEISPEDQKRIFNKFYQADESHATEGNGVGLAIVKRITDLHKGSVTVLSENNLTMFTVKLPKNQ